jgi:hypothetical protein
MHVIVITHVSGMLACVQISRQTSEQQNSGMMATTADKAALVDDIPLQCHTLDSFDSKHLPMEVQPAKELRCRQKRHQSLIDD